MGSGWKKDEHRLRLTLNGGTWIGTSDDFPSILVSGWDFEDVRARTIAEIHEVSFENYITPEYRILQARMHDEHIDYGMSARAYISFVLELIELHDFKSVLDYGCGKGMLRDLIFAKAGLEMADRIREYDPAIHDHDAPPEAAELLVAIDVLEHIEPEKLDFVLAHMRHMGWRMFFASVATVPATKTLADGRNAHLIVESQQWWFERLLSWWDMRACSGTNKGFTFVGVPK